MSTSLTMSKENWSFAMGEGYRRRGGHAGSWKPVRNGKTVPLSSGAHHGRMPEWPKGAACKVAGDAYGGSNPPPPTDPDRPTDDEQAYRDLIQRIDNNFNEGGTAKSLAAEGNLPLRSDDRVL